jgi:hypothetical protein
MTSSCLSWGNPMLMFRSPMMSSLHPAGHASAALQISSIPLIQFGGIYVPTM